MGLHGRQGGAALVERRRRAADRRRVARQLARREALLSEAELAAGLGSFERELGTGAVHYSKGFRTILAAPEDMELEPQALLARIHPDDRPMLDEAIDLIETHAQPMDLEARIRRFDGSLCTIRIRGSAASENGDRPARLMGTIQDVTEEAEARSAREVLSRVVDCSDDAILTKDRHGIITSWNRGAQRLYGYSAEEAVGRPISMLEPPELAGEQQRITGEVLAGSTVDHLETERVRKDGTRVSVSLTISGVSDRSGDVVLASVIARDITEHKRYESRLRHLAEHDQLTGLLNRRRFEEELKRELARAGRHSSGGAVISFDVDNFKAINDSAGHAAGDAVLMAVAKVLTSRFRVTDSVARMGGDEFAVLLSDVTPEAARSAAYDLLAALRAARPTFGGRALKIAASIGVAAFESDYATSPEVLVNADLAMYAAKTSGRDRVILYSASEGQRARALMRQPWAQRIRHALERDRFVLHLQPIVDLSTGLVSHGELLLRMKDDHDNLIAPGAFLPAAERQGLIRAVDRWVVRHAIELISDSEFPSSGPVGVNLSGDSVAGDHELLGLIEHELAQSQVNPSCLIFEVTETAAIANMPEATNFASGLRKLGCGLALDDFGTGFGSFYYLKHLPVGYIKLDGEFIQNLARSRVDEHVVQAIVGVARGMGIKTVAEQVPDDETLELLRNYGVDFAQGFHVGRPRPFTP